MALLRPAARLLSRRIFTTPIYRTITPITTSSSFTLPQSSSSQLPPTYTPRRYKTDNSKISPENRPVAVPGPSTPGDISTADSGTPPTPDPTKPGLTSGIASSKIYNFEDIQSLVSSPTPSRLLIDVREPSELLGTGRIPGSKNLPISTSPDSFFLNAEDFHDRFGWDKPGADTEVVFYCKAGVRSKAAARLAGQAGFGGKVGEYPGSWVEWSERGGKVERVE